MKTKFLIVDEQYRVYVTSTISGYVRAQVKKGNLTLINTATMQGMDMEGTWSDIQPWLPSFRIDKKEPTNDN